MRASYHNLLHLVAVGTIAALSVVLFNSRQAPQKAAGKADDIQANAKAHWEHLTKLKEQPGFLTGEQIKNEAKGLEEVTSEVEKAAERLKQAKKALNTYKLPITTSIDFTILEKKDQRIPLGATDPDGLWRSQMQNARATMRDAGIPATR